MPNSVREPSAGQLDTPGQDAKRVIQVELNTALQPMGVRANSPSRFRFTTADGKHIAGLHEVALEHEMHSSHPAVRTRYPGKLKRRKKGEKARFSRFVHLYFPGNTDLEEVLRKLRALPEVVYAAEYRGFSAPSAAAPVLVPPPFPKDPMLGAADQPNLQWYIFRCNIDQAWKRVSGTGVVIADVDFGFFLDHEDLVGQVDLDHLYNAWDGTADVTAGPQDHGTGVLGLAGAASNMVGIAGVAFNAKLWSIQYNTGNHPQLPGNALANGICWAALQDSGGGRVVINVEAQNPQDMGNCEQDPVVADAIRNAIGKGYVVCVTAGNGGLDAGLASDGSVIPPTGSILVGATAYDPASNPRAIAPGLSSNWGNRIVVSAPGDVSYDITCRFPAGYVTQFGGTSGAAAKVAGVIALMLEANPELTHDEVKSILTSAGTQLNNDYPMGVFLNAAAAVTAAIQLKAA